MQKQLTVSIIGKTLLSSMTVKHHSLIPAVFVIPSPLPRKHFHVGNSESLWWKRSTAGFVCLGGC